MQWNEDSDNFVSTKIILGARSIHNVTYSFSDESGRTEQIKEDTNKGWQELEELCDINSCLDIHILLHASYKTKVCKSLPSSERFFGYLHRIKHLRIITSGNEQSYQSKLTNVQRNDICTSILEVYRKKKLIFLWKLVNFQQGSITAVGYQVPEGLNRPSMQRKRPPSYEKRQQRSDHCESMRATPHKVHATLSLEASATKYMRILDIARCRKCVTYLYLVDAYIPRKNVKSQLKKYQNKSLSLQSIIEEGSLSISSVQSSPRSRRTRRRISQHRARESLLPKKKTRLTNLSTRLLKLISHRRKRSVDTQRRSTVSSTQSLQSLIHLQKHTVNKEKRSFTKYCQSLILLLKHRAKIQRRSTVASPQLWQSLNHLHKIKDKQGGPRSPPQLQNQKETEMEQSPKTSRNQQPKDDSESKLAKQPQRPLKKQATKESQIKEKVESQQQTSIDIPTRENSLPQQKAQNKLSSNKRVVQGRMKRESVVLDDVGDEIIVNRESVLGLPSQSDSQQPVTSQPILLNKPYELLRHESSLKTPIELKANREQNPRTKRSPSSSKRNSEVKNQLLSQSQREVILTSVSERDKTVTNGSRIEPQTDPLREGTKKPPNSQLRVSQSIKTTQVRSELKNQPQVQTQRSAHDQSKSKVPYKRFKKGGNAGGTIPRSILSSKSSFYDRPENPRSVSFGEIAFHSEEPEVEAHPESPARSCCNGLQKFFQRLIFYRWWRSFHKWYMSVFGSPIPYEEGVDTCLREFWARFFCRRGEDSPE